MRLLVFVLLLWSYTLFYGQEKMGSIHINTEKGHEIVTGSSGFNVRIADKIWNYTHPDFRIAVHELRPGWLRFFSGTMGDAFNSATGQYDLDYAMMFDKSEQYLTGYKFTEIKGPHRLSDLYALLGEINGKLVVTVNAFSETPEVTQELVRFIKNNDIEVALWQFCNEPYFYVPHRERFWWNNGYDYAVKMKPHADAILKEFPKANMALNFTWDGIWGFMKEINQYQKENGAYWNTFSKHSYAPHVGKSESQIDAYKRANTKLLEATNKVAMDEIEAYTQKNIPMAITEFGVWNRPLNGIYSSVYNIEYVMRQLYHANTKFVGAHEVSSKYTPKENLNHLILKAFKEGKTIQTDSIRTGVEKTLEGKAFEIFNDATNHSDWVYETIMSSDFKVPGLGNSMEDGAFAQSYRGVNGYDYLSVTNRSGLSKSFKIKIDGDALEKIVQTSFITADALTTENTSIEKKNEKNGSITIRPYSVTVAKWKSGNNTILAQPRIYDLSNTQDGVSVSWGPIENATGYSLHYGEKGKALNTKIDTKATTTYLVKHLDKDKSYVFTLKAFNDKGESKASDILSISRVVPDIPSIFKSARRDDAVTIMWRSVTHANGYTLKYVDKEGKQTIVDAKNVFGYRAEGLRYNEAYQFFVAAYNGLGQSEFSAPLTITPKKNIPFSPRDVSAREKGDGSIVLNWVAQDNNPEGTSYIVLRGEKLHEFQVLAKNITETYFEDTTLEKGKQYYYTVKSETVSGESNFYPNIATPIKQNKDYNIKIDAIEKRNKEVFLVKVSYENIPLDGQYSLGILYNNISYLTVEENRLEAKYSNKNEGTFQVEIPVEKLRKNSEYTIKAFINTNGKDIFSNGPDKKITIE